jgi:hypothetical protein
VALVGSLRIPIASDLAAVLFGCMPPGVTAVLLGLPLATGCVALLAGWVYQGRLPAVLPAIGVGVLLVNLLAAGGIGFPGVAGSLWLLMALGLNTAQADRPPRTLPRIAAVAPLTLVLVMSVACYVALCVRVLPCRGRMLAAQRELAEGNVPLAEADLRAAAKADPLAVGPPRQLAAIAFEAWRRDRSPGRFEQFERHNAAALELAPNSSRAWLASGDLYREAYAVAGRKADIQEAVEAYTRAVELYPNSGLYRAKLAFAHQAAGQPEAFRREADRALRLDEQTPHADKKLKPEIRRRLLP